MGIFKRHLTPITAFDNLITIKEAFTASFLFAHLTAMDNLSVDLEITDSQFDATIDKSKAKLQNFVDDAGRMKININASDFDKTLSSVERKALDIRFQLRQIASETVGKAGFDGLGQAALRAKDHVTDIYARLRQIEAASAMTNDPKLLVSLKQQAIDAQGELTKLETKMQRVAAGRAAVAERRAGSTGQGFGKYGQLAGAASSFLPPEASEVFSLGEGLSAAGVGAGSLAVFGGLAAAGAIIVKITRDIRNESERYLETENKVTAAWNKQASAMKDARDALKEGLKSADDDNYIKNRLKSDEQLTDELLAERRKTLQSLFDSNPAGENANYYSQEILGINSIQNSRQNAKPTLDDARKSFWEGVENRAKASEDERKEQEKFLKSVEEGKSKVEQLQKTWTSAFDSLFQRTAGENPFAAFLAKSTTEADKLKESLRGLDPVLQKTGFAMLAAAQAKELFALRINNNLGSYDLRNEAANFRNPFDPHKLQADQDQFVQRFLQNNPNYLYLNAGKTPDEIRKDILSRGDFDTPEKRLNRTLDDKYNLIYNRRDPNFDLATADRAFEAATQGVNPLELNDVNRDRAASVRERDASRRERYEADAQKTRQEQLAVQKQIAANTSNANTIAEQKGKLGVELLLKNQTGDPGTATVGNNDDVKNTFHFDGFGIVGGRNF